MLCCNSWTRCHPFAKYDNNRLFKNSNPEWYETKVIIIDMDFWRMDSLKFTFPNSTISQCYWWWICSNFELWQSTLGVYLKLLGVKLKQSMFMILCILGCFHEDKRRYSFNDDNSLCSHLCHLPWCSTAKVKFGLWFIHNSICIHFVQWKKPLLAFVWQNQTLWTFFVLFTPEGDHIIYSIVKYVC